MDWLGKCKREVERIVIDQSVAKRDLALSAVAIGVAKVEDGCVIFLKCPGAQVRRASAVGAGLEGVALGLDGSLSPSMWKRRNRFIRK